MEVSILEGDIQNPVRLSIDGTEYPVDAELWTTAYSTVITDSGYTESDPEALIAIAEVYLELLRAKEDAAVDMVVDTPIE